VYRDSPEILLKNDKKQVTLDTVRDMLDKGAEQIRLFFEELTGK
jgi:hypothetical protein